jgi:beta-galactosidase
MSVMDVKSAANIRAFVEKGGTVVMTCGSAIFDERGQMFRSTLPGLLDDVFGIRKGGYGETAAMNELSRRAAKGSEIIVNLEGLEITTYSEYFDWLAPQGATVLGSIVSMGKDYPIITSNQYGNGTAIYLGIPADEDLIGWLLDSLSDDLAIGRVANLPQGIRARMTDDSHLLLFNVTENPIKIPLDRKARSLLNGVVYKGSLVLDAQEPEFLEFY